MPSTASPADDAGRVEREEHRPPSGAGGTEDASGTGGSQAASQAAMAELGALTAGVAHDLATPTTALAGAAEHLASDLDALLALRAGDAAGVDRSAVARARARPEPTTAQVRALRRAIAAELAGGRTADAPLEHDRIAGSPGAGPRAAGAAQNDDHLARRLVEAGAETTEEAAALAAAGDDAVERAVLATRVGAALRRIDVAAAQIGTLVSGLRSYARAGGSAEAPPVPVDVADSLRTALTLTSHRLRRVTTETNLGDVAAVLAPPGRLEQVWTNVLVNAADALDGPGMVEIDLSTGDDGQVRVVVANDGPVIPPEDLERIFEPRFTTRPGSSDSGLGLGLSLCREIVTAAGGTMVARSAPGRTQMIVELPPPRGTRQAADGPAGEEWT